MNLFLITAAHDQHVGFNLALEYVSRSCSQIRSLRMPVNVMWIIADDGYRSVFDDLLERDLRSSYLRDVTVSHLREPDRPAGLESFRANMKALAMAVARLCGPEDLAAVIEDDWFSAAYLKDACEAMQNQRLKLWGETQTRYYRVDNRRHHTFRPNRRAALSATVFRAGWGADVILRWTRAAKQTIMLDNVMWRESGLSEAEKLLLPESKYVVGIKGLPGTKGLGIGGNLGEQHKLDSDGWLLRQWIGDDAEKYERFAKC